MTVNDLRWKLREFDDDTPIVVDLERFDQYPVYREPVIATVQRDAVNDEGKPYREWIVTL